MRICVKNRDVSGDVDDMFALMWILWTQQSHRLRSSDPKKNNSFFWCKDIFGTKKLGCPTKLVWCFLVSFFLDATWGHWMHTWKKHLLVEVEAKIPGLYPITTRVCITKNRYVCIYIYRGIALIYTLGGWVGNSWTPTVQPLDVICLSAEVTTLSGSSTCICNALGRSSAFMNFLGQFCEWTWPFLTWKRDPFGMVKTWPLTNIGD